MKPQRICQRCGKLISDTKWRRHKFKGRCDAKDKIGLDKHQKREKVKLRQSTVNASISDK